MYEPLALYIDGAWHNASDDRGEDVINPADESVLARLPHAGPSDLDRALEAADRGFKTWRNTTAAARAIVLQRAAELIKQRIDAIATTMTLEQGKTLLESRLELERTVETFRWFAEQATRIQTRTYPVRPEGFVQTSRPEPVGVVAAFTAWNFPAVLPARKLAPALAAGCALIFKAAEETPGTAVAIVRALADAGLPPGVVNLVFGVPSEVSAHLLASPSVRKLSFTGSVPVGKQLARLAADGLKRCTFELGGHAPAIVCADADLDAAVKATAAFKYRNAGQVCITPSRFFVHERIYDEFVDRFSAIARSLRVGDGMDEQTQMGPMANPRRLEAMERFVDDAKRHGARVTAGGTRLGNRGYYWAPTVLADVPDDTAIMTEEPFGPIAPIAPFRDLDDVIDRANALPYGLAAYAFTSSSKAATTLSEALEAGGVGINTLSPALADTPFGGVKESGYGYEGGHEGLEAFLHYKLVSRVAT